MRAAGLSSPKVARAARLREAVSRGIEGRKEEDAGLRNKGETGCRCEVVAKGLEMMEEDGSLEINPLVRGVG